MNATRTTCYQYGHTRIGKKKTAILVFGILAIVLSKPLYIMYRSPVHQEFLSDHLDHTVFGAVCRNVMANYNSDTPIVLVRGWDDEKISALPDAIRMLNPEQIWVSTNEVKLSYSQMVWVYGLHAIAKQEIQDNNDGPNIDVTYFKEWTKK